MDTYDTDRAGLVSTGQLALERERHARNAQKQEQREAVA